MNAMEKISSNLRNRVSDLKEQKREGRKIIGYIPGKYLPEELILACGATPVPVSIFRGGDHEAVLISGAYHPRWLDTFCRAQIGYKMLSEEAVYQMIDILIAPITDTNTRAIADGWEYYTDLEIFRFGVPHRKTERALNYYLDGLNLFKEKLEVLTGTTITDEALKEAIDLCNRERRLFREINVMRKSETVPISSLDFVTLNHSSFIADKRFMVDALEELVSELKTKQDSAPGGQRILFTGSTLALGDYTIFRLIEEAGGTVVTEEFAEGLRPYEVDVPANGDLMRSLAESYFTNQVCTAFFRPGRERLDYLVDLSKEFKVDGVIWYQMMYRDSYDLESYYFPQILKKGADVPMLKIETDYDSAETGQFRTRIETFIETTRR
ncbi:MAG: 2-hydroxyacyl-CoA dehydratase family protein [Desulfatiglans sp.]|nr:2-hydroxyacyl-CoA dehydratase family protein [Thermodesulfobacteriota bacterium]MEE4352247.1 2-hydroxyacyl-CoA dehydratase family protein [Desulfatiglans sp.]